MLSRIALVVAMSVAGSSARGADDIVFNLATIPALQRYSDLLEQPGYVAVAMENNGLSPSLASKLKIADRGRSAEIRDSVIRFVGKKGSVYAYEASYLLGLGDAKISFPVSVDIAQLSSGAVKVSLSPPLAGMIPKQLIDRMQIKVRAVASQGAQQKLIEYLDESSRGGNLVETILLDGYNRSGPPLARGDVGDAAPLSDQWMLLLTLAIWLVIVPGFLIVRRLRQRPSKSV
jgi:hypothetical protein